MPGQPRPPPKGRAKPCSRRKAPPAGGHLGAPSIGSSHNPPVKVELGEGGGGADFGWGLGQGRRARPSNCPMGVEAARWAARQRGVRSHQGAVRGGAPAGGPGGGVSHKATELRCGGQEPSAEGGQAVRPKHISYRRASLPPIKGIRASSGRSLTGTGPLRVNSLSSYYDVSLRYTLVVYTWEFSGGFNLHKCTPRFSVCEPFSAPYVEVAVATHVRPWPFG